MISLWSGYWDGFIGIIVNYCYECGFYLKSIYCIGIFFCDVKVIFYVNMSDKVFFFEEMKIML